MAAAAPGVRGRRQRAEWIGAELARRYPDPPIPLRHQDPYTLLIAVLLSAQCTDKRVNRITPALFAAADTPAAMAALPTERIRQIIRPCGLSPRKSQAISSLSRLLIERHGGQVPVDIDALEALPGVGHKTAAVVMAQAFGASQFPVDTHIHRLAKRWRLSSGRHVKQTEQDLRGLFPAARWNALHLQFIHYGREHCTARGCDGATCPICQVCGTAGAAAGGRRKN